MAETLKFATRAQFRKWLQKNGTTHDGIWVELSKDKSSKPMTAREALEEALCFGWIDGQLRRGDENFYLQKFTPRRKRSTWSKRNIEHVARLDSEGKMAPSGLKAVESAKADGRWDNSYDSQSNMTIPEDFLFEVSKDSKVLAFWESLNKVNKFAIVWRIQTAHKEDVRKKRMTALLAMLARGEKIHP